MEPMGGLKGFAIKRTSYVPRGCPERPEVNIAHILHHHKAPDRIMAKYGRGRYIDTADKDGNVGIIGVFNTHRIITDQYS
jgi:hypothetical protein